MKLSMVCGALLGLFITSATADFQQGYDAFNKGDYAAALVAITPLAEKGNAEAQKLLGSMYRFGRGVTQDAKEAAKWYRRSAEQGNVDAQQDLGFMYEFGSGVAKDAEAAVHWYRLAAEQGNVFAQRRLRDMNRVGQEVAQDANHQSTNGDGAEDIAMQASKSVFLRALLGGGAAAIPAGLLFIWIRVKGAASSAHQLGRKWLAWLVLSVTIGILSKFFLHFDLSVLAQWVIAVAVSGPLAYGLGWTYWKLANESPRKAIAKTMKRNPDNQLYEVAWDEIQSDKMEKGLWARSYAKCAGNQDKARALYVTERVKELRRSVAS